jgi:hydrogenase maturation protease
MCDAFPRSHGRAPLKTAHIIGVGSPFGADRIGWEVVNELARPGGWAELPPGRVTFSRCGRPDSSLLEALELPGLVILVDAMRSGSPAGTVRCFSAAELIRDGALISSHDFGIKSALSLATALGNLQAEVLICGIEIPFEFMPDTMTAGSALDMRGGRARVEILDEIKIILITSLKRNGYL